MSKEKETIFLINYILLTTKHFMRMKKLLTFLTLLTLFFTTAWAEVKTETLTSEIAASGGGSTTSTYSDWTFSFTDGTTYKGNSAASYESIQLRKSKNNQAKSGIITTSSIGKATKVAIVWNTYGSNGTNGTATGRVLNIYGKNTAYASPDDLYSDNDKGTLIGTIICGTSTELTISENYAYIGLCSNDGALYLTEINITWDTGGSTVDTYAITCNGDDHGSISAAPNPAAENATVTITPAPQEGYQLSTLTAYKTGDTNTPVSISNNQFTMPGYPVTVDATFAVIPTYSITVNGGGSASPNPAHEGQTVTVSLPDGKMIDTYTSTPEVTLAQDGDNYTFTMPNQAVILNLTLKDKPVQSGRFERITDVSKLEKDARYLIVYEGDDTHDPAVLGAISTTSTKYGISVPATDDNDKVNYTYANGVITLNSESAAKPLTLGGSSGAWTFELDGALLNHTGDGNTLTTGTQNTTWTISFDGTGTNKKAIITNCRTDYTRVMRYNNASNQLRFACYKGSTINNMQDIYLYKEVGTIVESSDLYIVGQVNGNDEDPFDPEEGVELTYSQTNGTYSGDFYCKGMNGGYSYLLFSKSIPADFDNDKSNLYGAGGNGNAWVINESDYGNAIPLYATSSDSFRLPAGLYSVSIALSGAGFEWTDASVTFTTREKTMVINGSQYFEDTREVTMTSNLTDIGGKIYYTTDGGNPSDPNSSRQEYTGPITINATTTFKAVAFVGNLYSAVVDKTFTKTPKTPVITPNGGTITEATQVTITCETEGASIYYTLDGTTTPTNVVSETNFLYSGPFTISETTTVKARAYVGNTYSNGIATAEFVYTEPIAPGTGDFIRVTSEDDLVAGREYIIVAEGYTYAMGAVTSNKKGSATTDFEITQDHSTVTAGDAVNILKLGDGQVYENNDNKYWTLTQQDGKKFLLGQTSTDIQAQTYIASGCTDEFIINIANTTSNNNEIKYAIVSGGGGRQIWFNGEVFGHYANSIASSYSHVFLYYREGATVPPTEATLAVIESAQGVKDTKYAIADDYLVAVESRDVTVNNVNYVYVWCKDENNVTNKLEPANENIIDFMKKDSEAQGNRPWDQSNWVVLRFKGDDQIARGLKGYKITDIVGTYIENNNYMIDVESYTKGEAESYTPNVYCVANFNPANWGANGVQQPNAAANAPYYFFMTPKVQEVCEITYAEWNGTTFTVPESSGFAKNTLTLGWDYNENNSNPMGEDDVQEALEDYIGTSYKFIGVVQRSSSKGAIDGGSVVYPMNLTGGEENDVPTAINGVVVNGQVKSVKYVNVAGMVSDVPFQGVNIVVTEYTDGSRTTSKMLRK
jgi:hypothetical protein